jgi:hypothetical protein
MSEAIAASAEAIDRRQKEATRGPFLNRESHRD